MSASFIGMSLLASPRLVSAQVSPPLGTAQNFAVLAGSTVTNTGPSVITGDLGLSPGTSVTGFPPGTVQNGAIDSGDAVALQAESDTATAYKNIAGQACTASYDVPTDIGGLVLKPGVYCFASSAQITGTLTLDGGGNPNSVWVFKTGSTLITASDSSVQLINGAQQCKAFWEVGSSATLGTGSTFVGSILSLASITLNTNATLSGRALAMNGAVTLDSNTVAFSPCLHGCYEVTSRVTHTIMVAPPLSSTTGKRIAGTVTGATISPDGKSVWVAGYNSPIKPGFVSRLDVSTYGVSGTTPVGASPSDISFSAANRAWVTNQYDSTISQIDANTQRFEFNVPIGAAGSQFPTASVFAGNRLMVSTTNAVPVYNTTWPLTLSKTMAVSGQAGRSVKVPSTASYQANKVLVPTFVKVGATTGYPSLNIVDSANASVISTVRLASSGAVPEAVVVTPNGHFAYVSLYDSTGGAGGVWVVDLKSMTTSKVIVTGDSANMGEAMSADGRYMLVAGFLKNQVALIYTASNSVDNVIQGGEQPNAIALANDDSDAFITNQTDGTVTVISFKPHI